LRRPRHQRLAACPHLAVPDFLQLSRHLSRFLALAAGIARGAIRRSLLRALHLWLADRAMADAPPWRHAGLAQALRSRLAADRGSRLPLLASRRAARLAPEARQSAAHRPAPLAQNLMSSPSGPPSAD